LFGDEVLLILSRLLRIACADRPGVPFTAAREFAVILNRFVPTDR